MKDFLKYVMATITGIVLLTVVMGILSVISLVGLAASSASTTKVEENSVMTLQLSGIVEERTAQDPFAKLTGQVSENLGLDNIIKAIKKAKDEENIKGIYIEAGLFAADAPASLHAIREALVDFKKSGKWIVAYADSYEQSTYYICSVADKLWLNPEGMVDWHGLGATPYFVKDLLAKLGIKVQLNTAADEAFVDAFAPDAPAPQRRPPPPAPIRFRWRERPNSTGGYSSDGQSSEGNMTIHRLVTISPDPRPSPKKVVNL